MISSLAQQFFLDERLVYLNHASYGVATRSMMSLVEEERKSIERDTAGSLGSQLYTRLSQTADSIAELFNADSGSVAIVPNSTTASAALVSSLRPNEALRIVMLDLEYPSVIRGWQHRSQISGGSVELVRITLPIASTESLLDTLEFSVSGSFDVLVVSAITSSTALTLPVRDITGWAKGRGAIAIVDAAHAGMQSPLDIMELNADAVFGSLHKWLPIPRPVGYLWLSDALTSVVRPSEVSLRWDDESVVDRFGWRGTWDPSPVFRLSDAVNVWRNWELEGLLTEARNMTELAMAEMRALGLSPTGPKDMLPPLMRTYILGDVDASRLRRNLLEAGLRVWLGESSEGLQLLRIATHVYTSSSDIYHLRKHLARALASPG